MTGSDGFTGRYVCDAFEKAGWLVYGSGLRTQKRSPRSVFMDLTQKESIRSAIAITQPDVVVHLAAVSFAANMSPQLYSQVNLIGTLNLLEELKRVSTPPSLTIVASSANVYGNSSGSPLDEPCAVKPESDYAVSKLGMECIANLFRSDLKVLIARPFNYTGIGQSEKFLVPKIVSHLKRNAQSIELGNLNVERDFSDVRDVAGYYLALAEAPYKYDVVNFCSGKGTSLQDILQMGMERAGYEMKVIVKSEHTREREVYKLVGDRRRLNEILGDDRCIGFGRTLDWMLNSR